MITFLIIATAFVAGFVQSVTGFGCNVVMMAVLPFLITVTEAAVVSDLCAIALVYALTWTYRISVDWRKVALPAVFYFIFGAASIRLSASLGNLKPLEGLLGFFLFIFAIIMGPLSDKIHLKGNVPAAVGCGTISGIMGGLFSMGGPGMAFYNLSVAESKEEYLGNSSFFLALAATENNALRIAAGLVTEKMLPWALGGAIAMLLGKVLGDRVVRIMLVNTLKKSVYGLMGLSGVITLLKSAGIFAAG